MKKYISLAIVICMLMGFMVPMYSAEGTDITILYENDIHTYIDWSQNKDKEAKISYATLAQMKKDYQDAGKAVFVVDAGDHMDGTAYGTMDKGESIVKIMNEVGYDAVALGNHDFGFDSNKNLNVLNWATYDYVSCNVYKDNQLLLAPYKMVEADGKKIAFVGISTPESISKGTPTEFQDENGDWLYTIAGGDDGSALYSAVQLAIDSALQDGADYVIAVGHLGDDYSAGNDGCWTSVEVIKHTSGLDAFIDGHSHTENESSTVKTKDGKDCLLTSTGNYFNYVGVMHITDDGITTKLVSNPECNKDGETYKKVRAMEEALMENVDTALGEKIAETDIKFTINDEETGLRAVRSKDTNMADLVADAHYYYLNELCSLDVDVTVVNGGGVRSTVNPGDWTYKDAKTVNPFGNVLCVMEVTGQMLLDALEWGARDSRDKECGGFLIPGGATYEIDLNVVSTVQKDEDGMWAGGPTGEYRVKNVKIYNKETGEYEPLDLEKTYRFGGMNYTLRQMGDGFRMLAGPENVLVADGITQDYLSFASYLKDFTDSDNNGYANISTENSPLNEKYSGLGLDYENLAGNGRISFIEVEEEEKPNPDTGISVRRPRSSFASICMN